MHHLALRTAIIIVGAVLLAGCGRPDAYSVFPEFIRQPRPTPRQPDPEPDVAELVRGNINSIFTRQANPRNLMISRPRRNHSSYGWKACIMANITSIGGEPTGVYTIVVFIDDGKIGFRRKAEPNDECQAEQYVKL